LRCVHREFSYKSPGERILKIGPHLPKLLSNIKGLGFLEYGVDIIRYVIGCNKSTSRIFTGTFVIMQINLKQFCEKLKHFYFSFIAIVTTAKIKPLCKFFKSLF